MSIKTLINIGNGKCGVAVIRVSGEKTREIVKSLTGSDKLKARYASLKKIFDPSTKVLIDNGLVLFFESPRSFTGEDCCEFQVHGGNAVVTALLNALSKIEGCRPAEPGEFTKRAFYNGKMDLTEVEGLADLIHAETEFQRRQAITQADGHLSKLYGKWREKLIRNIAHIEAFIDFSEDENIEDNVLDNVQEQLVNLTIEIEKHLADGRKGERLRDGVKMAIIGDTNVGKSSLMNLLVRRDVSIVTNVEGTTRDIIETPYDIGGYPIILADTAGLRKSDDIVESEGIARAKKYASNADLVIVMIDGEKLSLESLNHHHEFCENYLRRLGFEENAFDDVKMISIVNKIDKMNDEMLDCLKRQKILSVSCTKHLNIDKVIDEVRRNLEELCGNPNSESPTLSHARHRFYLEECLKYLHHFNESFHPEQEQDFAILVQSLRNSIRCIGRVTGEIRTDDILDVIFKDFCIGK
jgi:tRNA modification GTPase